MKYFIALAGIASIVRAGDVPPEAINTNLRECPRDNCLRSVIASNVATRPGLADCSSFFLTTVTPAPETVAWPTVTTTDTVTLPVPTVTVTSPYAGTTVVKRAPMPYMKGMGGFKKVKRQEPGTAVTVTNQMPSYMTRECTDLNGVTATDRYSSACRCVGITGPATTTVAIPTVSTPTTVAAETPETETPPAVTVTAYEFLASVTGGPASVSNTFLGTVTSSPNTFLAPSPSPVVPITFRLEPQPDGRLYAGGLRVVSKVSTIATGFVRYLTLIPDADPLPADHASVTCTIDENSLLLCVTDTDYVTWIMHRGTFNSLRLRKTSFTPTGDYTTGFDIKVVAPPLPVSPP